MQRELQIQEKLDFFKNALHLQVGCHIGGSPAMQGCKEEQLCVYRKNADACQGDSGGPVVWLNPESERYEQVVLGDELPNILKSSRNT